MEHPDIQLRTVFSNPFGENTFVAWHNDSQECLIIDPGLEPAKILAVIEQHELTPAALLLTHGHIDHIGGNHAMKAAWPDCPLVIGAGDVPKLTDPVLNLSAKYGLAVTSPPADVTVVEGDVYSAAGFDLEVFEVPGHSIGHVVFVWKDAEPFVIFGGDVLFAGSIGRTDFPAGSFGESSARSKMFLA